MTNTTERPWVGEMIVVHRVFRRESRLLPKLVLEVAAGDVARARLLAEYIHDYQSGLHEHHTAEDQLLWPLLLARVDLDAELVLRMEEQHKTVAVDLDTITDLLPRWAAAGDSDARQSLVAVLLRHHANLLLHLDEEETSILPLVQEHITVPEWKALGERFVSTTPKEQLLFFLGALLEDATASERARMLASLPMPTRIAWHTVGHRAYARRLRRVRGQ